MCFRQLIAWIGQSDTYDWQGYVIAISFFVTYICQTGSWNWAVWSLYKVGIQARAGITASCYRKVR